MLRVGPKPLYMLGKYSATELRNKGILSKNQTTAVKKTKSCGHSWANTTGSKYSMVRFLFVFVELGLASDSVKHDDLELLTLPPLSECPDCGQCVPPHPSADGWLTQISFLRINFFLELSY